MIGFLKMSNLGEEINKQCLSAENIGALALAVVQFIIIATLIGGVLIVG